MVDDWELVETGSPDLKRLQTTRTVADEYEPLVGHTMVDSPLDPQTLHLHMEAGIRAETGRFDVTWTEKGYYNGSRRTPTTSVVG